MFPLKKILCPLDFSDFSVRALKTSVELADKFKAKIILCHIVNEIPNMNTAYDAIDYQPQLQNIQEFVQEMQVVSTNQLDELAKKYGKSVPYEKKVATGMPADEIVQMAKEEKIDLIVLTTHGRTGLSRIFMGSVAEGVIRHAPCPVLSIRIKDKN